MNKEKEVDVVDSREVELELTEKVDNLIIMCKIRESPIRNMMTKARLNGKVVIITKKVLVPVINIR